MSEYTLEDLLYLMSRLRDPRDGCPWDRAQDFNSIVKYTIEESYELADAIESQNFAHIREELGDVLFQVVFYAQLAQEQEQFAFNDIVTTLVGKLLRRHPHVFPSGELDSRADQQRADSDEVKRRWEAIKATERQSKQQQGVLDDIPMALPALSRAVKLQKRAAQTGFDWPEIDGVLLKLKEELDELIDARQQQCQQYIEEELGDVLFSIVNLARHLSVDPEASLRGANKKFDRRFRYIESALNKLKLTPEQASLAQMDALWDEAKSQGL